MIDDIMIRTIELRREMSLTAKPQTFRVRVSADNRFVLYVNQQRIGAGPARGDLNIGAMR